MHTSDPRSTDSVAVKRLVAAARRCYARNGVRNTRISAVADAAGMVRQTVYTFVSGRQELLELVLAERLHELAELLLARVVEEPASLRERFVERFATMAETPRDDPEASELLAAMGSEAAFRFMTGPSPAQAPVVLAMTPLYEAAVAQDALREDLSPDEVAWWARSVCTPLIARSDLTSSELRALIRKFAIPALLK